MNSEMEKDILKVLVTEEELKTRIAELGEALYKRYEGHRPLFLGVLKGSFIFMADLMRASQLMCDVEFIAVSSYQNGTVSSGRVQITHDLQQDITGREIVIVEDILDSGNTLAFLKSYLMAKGAKSISIVTPGKGGGSGSVRLCGAGRIRGGLRSGLCPALPESALHRCAEARRLRKHLSMTGASRQVREPPQPPVCGDNTERGDPPYGKKKTRRQHSAADADRDFMCQLADPAQSAG